MKLKIEILLEKNKTVIIENQSNEIKEFLIKISDKYPDWEEFILSNHINKQIRILKLKDRIIPIGKIAVIGKLMNYLNTHYKEWKRFAISVADFPNVANSDFKEGMLIRLFGSNTNQYNLIMGRDGDKVSSFQEGKYYDFSVEKNKKYKYKILSENLINFEEYKLFEWPDSKK